MVGTPGYMSPEQAQGGTVDGRSDLFALGAVAYRVLTGRRPFTGNGTPQLLYQVVYAQPVRPREVASEIPRDVELVLAIALAKLPKARFPTSASFALAMRAAARGELDAKMRAHAEKLLRAAPWSAATTQSPPPIAIAPASSLIDRSPTGRSTSRRAPRSRAS